MRKKEVYNSIIEICPVRNVIARFGNKWALLVLLVISENNPVRFNELSRLIPDVSTRVLSNTLKVLEADGLITRTMYPQVPPRVEYSMTATGLSLIPIILQLTVWAKENMKTVIDHRRKFEKDSQNKKDSASHCPSGNN
ncbi:MAG: helix-turn-helix transcriptional regulator [Muribaculaceae bacterium]|nr:helix-turn-helix transcriptional regulator [Muribaculaceae bacterium]